MKPAEQQPLMATRCDDAIEISSEFWRVRHESACGGCVTDIRILHGTGANLLLPECGAEPLA
jgi:hypothetical protein